MDTEANTPFKPRSEGVTSDAAAREGVAPSSASQGVHAVGSPAKSKDKTNPRRLPPLPARKDDEAMVVSDSEEERQRCVKARRAVLANVNVNELPVIEISSDEEDSSSASFVAQKGASQTGVDTLGHEDRSAKDDTHSDEDGDSTLFTPARRPKPCQTPRARRVVVSSDSEDEGRGKPAGGDAAPKTAAPARRLPPDDDIIDLTISSPESEGQVSRKAGPSVIPARRKDDSTKGKTTERSAAEEAENTIPLFVDDSDDDVIPDDPFAEDEGSILVLNEPRSARKPARRIPLPARKAAASPFTLLRHSHTLEDLSHESGDEADLDPVKPRCRTSTTFVSNARSAVSTPAPAKAKAPRMTKKMLMQAELERRRAYASDFFKELNETVFGGGIPENTELVWSKRLLTTAGRAHWRKDRHGTHITSIQLAEKVLDCEERIRNTLSHEMCHLACWIISDAPDEQHGSLFKGWAQKVMRKRADVEVTTKHDYEIKHKYQWKCEDCEKIYGRHSKSINPEEHVCGGCKGRLVPQFQSRRAPRTPKPKADSQNAAVRGRDSPLVMPGAFPASPAVAVKSKDPIPETRVTSKLSDDEDSDIEILAHTFKQVQIVEVTGI
ncbi:hypothetical protein BV20DRAFT_1024402 [Pilatotrama ljubarskyi]|nr:hypothetical protein BV20DRAFT_1024402 [Pilatotrama ljubarskyi]